MRPVKPNVAIESVSLAFITSLRLALAHVKANGFGDETDADATIEAAATQLLAQIDRMRMIRMRLQHVHDDMLLATHELDTGRPYAARKALVRAMEDSKRAIVESR